jgi:hypothetical protein
MDMAGARAGTIRRTAAVCATSAIGLVVGGCGDSRSATDETTRDDAGVVIEGGRIGVFQLRIGDCVLLPGSADGTELAGSASDPTAGPVTDPTAAPVTDPVPGSTADPAPESTTGRAETLVAVPCPDPHTGEVMLVDRSFFADLDQFPGEDAAFESATEACIDALEAYTGEVYGDGPLDYFALVPTEESWTSVDDRELVCIGLTLDDTYTRPIDTRGSLRSG